MDERTMEGGPLGWFDGGGGAAGPLALDGSTERLTYQGTAGQLGVGGTAGQLDVDGAGGQPALDAGSETTGSVSPAIVVAGQGPTTQVGTTIFGAAYADECPSGEVVIGYVGTTSRNPAIPWLQSIQTQCGRLLVSGAPYTITTSLGSLLPERGSNGGVAWSSLCPAGQVIVGFQGYEGGYVYQLAFRCAAMAVVGDATSYGIALGAITTLPPAGPASGTEFGPIECPGGQIAVGSNIQADTWPRAFGLFCGAPSFVSP